MKRYLPSEEFFPPSWLSPDGEVHLPSWMSPGVAHSHVMSLKLAAEIPERDPGEPSYFLNIEKKSDKSDIPKNRSIRLEIELDENGDIIEYKVFREVP